MFANRVVLQEGLPAAVRHCTSECVMCSVFLNHQVKEMAGEVAIFANDTRLFNIQKYIVFFKTVGIPIKQTRISITALPVFIATCQAGKE